MIISPIRILARAWGLAAKDGGWGFLYGTDFAYKAQVLRALHALPGVFVAIVLGIALNVILEWIISKIHRPASKSNYWALVGLALTIYLSGFTRFNSEVARVTRWNSLFKPQTTTPSKNPAGSPSVRFILDPSESADGTEQTTSTRRESIS